MERRKTKRPQQRRQLPNRPNPPSTTLPRMPAPPDQNPSRLRKTPRTISSASRSSASIPLKSPAPWSSSRAWTAPAARRKSLCSRNGSSPKASPCRPAACAVRISSAATSTSSSRKTPSRASRSSLMYATDFFDQVEHRILPALALRHRRAGRPFHLHSDRSRRRPRHQSRLHQRPLRHGSPAAPHFLAQRAPRNRLRAANSKNPRPSATGKPAATCLSPTISIGPSSATRP